jgi:hypothetical protein
LIGLIFRIVEHAVNDDDQYEVAARSRARIAGSEEIAAAIKAQMKVWRQFY